MAFEAAVKRLVNISISYWKEDGDSLVPEGKGLITVFAQATQIVLLGHGYRTRDGSLP